jgi:hypothetical protein
MTILRDFEGVTCEDQVMLKLGYGDYVLIAEDGTTTEIAGNRTISVENSTKIHRKILKPRAISHYEYHEKESEDSGKISIISKDEMQQMQSELKSKYWDDTECEFVFKDLEEEYEYKKAMQALARYQCVYEPSTHCFEEMVIKIIGSFVNTGSKYIENTILAGGSTTNSNKGFFKVLSSSAAEDEARKIVSKYKNKVHIWNIPNHSNIRFMKVNEKYVFENKYPFSEGHIRWFSDLKSAKEEEAAVRKIVKCVLLSHILPRLPENLDLKTISSELCSIQSSIRDVEPMKKSIQRKQNLLNKVDTLLKLIDSHILETYSKEE